MSSLQSLDNESMAPPTMNQFSPSARRLTEDSASGLRNVDVIPLLAYYAQAIDILGNCHGGNDLPYVQANWHRHLRVGVGYTLRAEPLDISCKSESSSVASR